MKIGKQKLLAGTILAIVAAAGAVMWASAPTASGIPAQMAITVQAAHRGGNVPNALSAGDLRIIENKTSVPVVGLERFATDLSDLQLFILLDDSTRSTSLGIHLPELKAFLRALPETAQVAVGYMRNGTFDLVEPFTSDRPKAANSLRLPQAIPGENGSPYFVLSDLAKHWPPVATSGAQSKEPAARRAVLVFTDGVDRYYDAWMLDDPYVAASVRDTLKNSIAVYTIYLRGAGYYRPSGWLTNLAQSRLIEVSEQTGGYSYFEEFTDPVTITPFLKDFRDRLENQYRVTFQALNERGVQPVKLRSELPGIKIEGPSRIYIQ